MSSEQHKNPKADTSAASLQSAPREEESCLVPSPCDSRSSMSSAVNDQPAFENSSQKGGDDVAAWSQDNRAPSLPEPELVSDSEDDPTDDNVSSDTPTDNGAGSNGAMCRICHEGYQEEQLVSLCSCSGTMGFVHVSCLERWINEKSVDFCELCGQRFPMAARRGDVLRFIHWVSQSTLRLRRALLRDFLLSVALIMVTVASIAFFLRLVLSEERHWDRFFEWVYYGLLLYLMVCVLLYLYLLMFDRLCDWHNMFLAWQYAHPGRRILTVPSARVVTLGRTERGNDERAAAEPATSGRRRRR
ncbi:E3 ubiquitin-protein ligase MARCHF3 isoform X1 [Rhipicephalus sanguineus]|uniref:E3 ubiquitin-protein ligase MARCHF3 isoform X1 n=1 Tax=Rhipicephalus sanguineus TaxID=34632 RepID=UPI001893886C|nr:E3 ubiquitin-protein ligase MARCHF3 isoform X1 [Rhipicephalus sanguineus]